MAQTMVGSGMLPEEYSRVYQELLEECPRRDIGEVKQLMHQMGIELSDVFEQFDDLPVGAASIGQVPES